MSRSFSLELASQGDTGTASQVKINLRDGNYAITDGAVRVHICNDGTYVDSTNATIAPVAGKGQTQRVHTTNKEIEVGIQKTVKAAGELSVTGVGIQGETVTLGKRVYELDAGGGVTAGRVAVDISGGDLEFAQGTLTVDTQPTAEDTMTIGTRTYVFKATGTTFQDGEITVGADLAAAKLAIVAAINGTDAHNTAHTEVTAAAFAADDCVITAIVGGVAGNSLVSTETFTAGTNVFDAATLGTTTAGVDAIAADVTAALETAINWDASAAVTATSDADDVFVTAKVGVAAAGNAIPSTETMANGAFGGATLSGGYDQQDGEITIAVTDAQAETVTLRVGRASFNSLDGDYLDLELDVTHAAP